VTTRPGAGHLAGRHRSSSGRRSAPPKIVRTIAGSRRADGPLARSRRRYAGRSLIKLPGLKGGSVPLDHVSEQDQTRRLLAACIASLTEPPASATWLLRTDRRIRAPGAGSNGLLIWCAVCARRRWTR